MFTCARLLFLPGLLGAILVSPLLRADTGDVNGSRDYPGLPRIPGFIITNYNEDNSAAFDFPVAHPTSLDADHVDTVRVKGHRYVIRYEVSSDDMQAPSLLQIQQYYEKLAKTEGFTMTKSGAVRDVTETFHLSRNGHDLWVYLDPSITIDILTIVEGGNGTVLPPAASPQPPAPPPLPSLLPSVVTAPPEVPGPTPEPPRRTVASTPALAVPKPAPEPLPSGEAILSDSAALPALSTPGEDLLPTETNDIMSVPPVPAPPPVSPPPSQVSANEPTPAPTVSEDDLYSALMAKGRAVLPITFLPGQPDLNVDSASVVVSLAALLQKHPDLRLEIDGYTDNTGDPQSNQHLSAERAETVRRLLVADHIPESRLIAVGLGGSDPVADNHTPEGREKNRRIELAIGTDSPPAPVVAEPPPEEPVPSEGPATDNSPTFHAPAPNGVNYYPTN